MLSFFHRSSAHFCGSAESAVTTCSYLHLLSLTARQIIDPRGDSLLASTVKLVSSSIRGRIGQNCQGRTSSNARLPHGRSYFTFIPCSDVSSLGVIRRLVTERDLGACSSEFLRCSRKRQCLSSRSSSCCRRSSTPRG